MAVRCLLKEKPANPPAGEGRQAKKIIFAANPSFDSYR